jgi:hypothetical protein
MNENRGATWSSKRNQGTFLSDNWKNIQESSRGQRQPVKMKTARQPAGCTFQILFVSMLDVGCDKPFESRAVNAITTHSQ